MNESFWDAHGVEIGACAIFEHFVPSGKIDGTGKKMTESILWGGLAYTSVLKILATITPGEGVGSLHASRHVGTSRWPSMGGRGP